MQITSPKHACMQEVLHDTRGPEGNAPPCVFDTGMGLVPEAVDIAVRLMTPQEVSTVTASPRYAYQGRTDRPPVSCSGIVGTGVMVAVQAFLGRLCLCDMRVHVGGQAWSPEANFMLHSI